SSTSGVVDSATVASVTRVEEGPRRRPQKIACLAPIVYHHERSIMVNQTNFIAPYCDDFIFFAANRSAPEYFNGYRVHN
ncbi:unnamed protein product, partial [Amoebophrya sp. A25]